ncbi:MAG: hypothetical protein ACD_4C00481G0006 [uncultured bacterium (gcode 4)]|uniref:Nudix hydrolase domain-containing protein n=1 Tax=uncultured bacterium (gcode 4) TaxID=1234023 RepID=K2F4D9_9BACT|nr:MAG: hypothetical protein ACD_4C00481G0006 [uncultured bacterium (gcode 4)]
MGIYLEKPEIFNPKFEIVSSFCEFNNEFILLLRQDHKPEPNTLWVPAWKIDEWEDSLQAIKREIKEETWIILEDKDINFYKKIFVKYPTYDFIYYMFYVNFLERPEVIINQKEHKEFIWTNPIDSLQLNLIWWLNECIRLFYKI